MMNSNSNTNLEKYSTEQYQISSILGLIASNNIAIPEIQRPFVWKKTQVRDLLDSLYRGYPTGYLIIWKNHDVRLKNGKVSSGQQILIDGQQRVTALMTAIAGMEVVNSNYKKERIKIAFDPFQAISDDKDAEIFAVQDSSHLKSKRWIADISEIFSSSFSGFSFVREYCANNPDMNEDVLNNIINKLRAITSRTIGVINLSNDLDIDIVTDIFIRINSKGSALSQGDFVMSKIAADDLYGGNFLHKAIDFFSHLFKDSSFLNVIKEDSEFCQTDYFKKISWLGKSKEFVYEPDCDDVIRVAFMHKYPRAKLADLVSLLSGRDFETREYKEEIIADTFEKMKSGVIDVINEYNYQQFSLAIASAGFISKKLINSKMALDFAYTLYLILIKTNEVTPSEVKRLVQKWYVLSVLTGRYSASPESAFAKDIRLINEKGVVATLKEIEAAIISETFWKVAVVQNLNASSTINPTYLVYLAAQVKNNEVSLLSNNVLVKDLIDAGDIHHIFPKEYLKENGLVKSEYNQNANYAFLDSQVNKSIGKKSPTEYFSEAKAQCSTGEIKIGSIMDYDSLISNLKTNCIPDDIFEMDNSRYEEFLNNRRFLMAEKIKTYYASL